MYSVKKLLKKGMVMPIDEIKKVAFIGGGTMGSFNSMVAAVAGYEPTGLKDEF